MKNLLFVFACAAFIHTYRAQDFFYKDYDWSEVPENFELSDEEKLLDEVVLKKKETIHLVPQDERIAEYRLVHKIIRLNTDAGIERYNKWYLTNGAAFELILQKARVIKPDGRIIVQSDKDIKESINEEGEVEYRYFAFEGIEKGSTIEFLELGLYPAKLTGSVFKVQHSSLIKNLELEIISPDFLVYSTYPVNGIPDFELDTVVEDYRRVFLHLDKVEALKEEEWSTYRANLQKVYYKFNRNLNTGKGNFYTYSTVTKNIHELMFATPSKKESSEIKKFLKPLNLNGMSDEEKIHRIENEMKKNFYIIEQSFENGTDIGFILSKQVMSEDGFYKLFLNCLRELGIAFELVVTCDRYEDKFLTDYEAYNFLQDYLLFLPDQDKFISHDLFHRFGFVPYEFISNKGLFIKEVTVGDLTTGVGKVKTITFPPAKESVDKMIVNVALQENLTECNVQIERICSGYKAQPYQTPLNYLTDDQKKEVKEDYIAYIDEGATIESMEFENDNSDSFGISPLVGKGSFTTKNYLEKGGDKLLLKVGVMIGPQSELYNREERVQAVESPYPREYIRSITVTIPEGYVIKNPKDLILDIQPYGEKGSIGFVSSYELEGNQLEIYVKEWYNEMHFEASTYPEYEKVINAAADFNKIVLILQPGN